MSSLVDAVARRLPPQCISLASPVNRLTPLKNGGWALSIGRQQSRTFHVDAVILATPAHQASKLLVEVDPAVATQLARIDYAGAGVVSLGYCRTQIKQPLNAYGFVVPLVEHRTILACSFSSVKYAERAPQGAALLRVVIGGACQSGLLHLSNDELAELAQLEVAELLGIRGKPMMRHVVRHGRAMPQYQVGHEDHVANIMRRLGRFPTLALAGSAYSGIGVPACIRSGEAAVERILSRANWLNQGGAARPACDATHDSRGRMVIAN
jgi:oxygen-dependent protoporphyrinogen oxidase